MDERHQPEQTLIYSIDEARAHSGVDANLESVYTELRRLAGHIMKGQRSDQTLQATALVHEAYIRMAGADDPQWKDRRHFYNSAAMVMRRLLVDRARARARVKRGGGRDRAHLDQVEIPATCEYRLDQMEAVDTALHELWRRNPRAAEIVQMRLFAGLGVARIAEVLGVSEATVKNDWRYARAWLACEVDPTGEG